MTVSHQTPTVSDDLKNLSQPVFMYKIGLPSMPKSVSVSGHYVIVLMQDRLKIIDLTSPSRTFSLRQTPPSSSLKCEIINEEFLLVSEKRHHSSAVTRYSLHALLDDGGALGDIYAGSGFFVGELLSIPHSVSFDAASSQAELFLWLHCTDRGFFESTRVKGIRASTSLSNLPDHSRGSSLLRAYPIEILYSQLKYAPLWWDESTGTSEDILERVAIHSISSLQGYDHLISVVSTHSSLDENTLPEHLVDLLGERTTIVVTRVAPNGKSLVHKQIFVLNTSGDQKKPITDRSRKEFAWNEASGRIAVKSWEGLDDERTGSKSPTTICLYHLSSISIEKT
ncbi:hypothetical protein DL93DRAFT_371447 [Clavulina sp. PMI_390]|nr:hypothetical protein DL93DRAFT_371447 [Clavulina sp. PMI_390]